MKARGKGKGAKRSSFARKKDQGGERKGFRKVNPKAAGKSKGVKKDGRRMGRGGRKDERRPDINRKVRQVDPNRPTHKQQNMQTKKQRKEQQRIHKLFIVEELKKQNPDSQKIKSHLSQLKSRGLRQRLKSKLQKLSS